MRLSCACETESVESGAERGGVVRRRCEIERGVGAL